MRGRFTGSEIREVDASLPGTGSDLGAFRCGCDLLEHHPDLVFVEFAVNDGALDRERSARGMEGILRQLLSSGADVVVVLLTSRDHAAQSYDLATYFWTVNLHSRIAAHYGVQVINPGKALWTHVREGYTDWQEVAPDGTHPGDLGYLIYAEEVRRFLELVLADSENDSQASLPVYKPLPEPLYGRPFERTHIVPADSFDFPGWMPTIRHVNGREYSIISSNTVDARIAFPFSGTAIGTYWLVTPDSGRIRWTVDNTHAGVASSWDHYALEYPSRINYSILHDSLVAGPHELSISVDPLHDELSTGTWIRLVGLLVAA
jgi:hypothetical protein